MNAIRANPAALLLPILCWSTVVHAEDSASGMVNIEGSTFNVVDVIAYPNRDGLAIALTDSPFDKEKMRADGKVDSLDRLMHEDNAVMINLSQGKPTMCVDYLLKEPERSSSGSICESGVAEAVILSENSSKRVAGKMKWKKDTGEMLDVSFNAQVEPGGD